MPPPLFGRHDADHPAVATAPKSVRRSFACGTEPTNECGSVATAPCEGELSAAPSWPRGSSSRDELMFGGVQLVLGRVEKCCLFAMGGNLEPPPPVQHDAHAHRGSDHDHGRGRPPVRDQGCQDGNAHAGKDRMPLDARSPLHVVTLIAVEHRRLTPWIRFGNRHSVHELAPQAKSPTMSSSLPRPIQSRSTSLPGVSGGGRTPRFRRGPTRPKGVAFVCAKFGPVFAAGLRRRHRRPATSGTSTRCS
jgi:hypothetical protein